MDCFVDFYEQLEAFISAPRNEYSVDLSNDVIDEEYFEKIDYASSSIVALFDNHISNQGIHDTLHELINTRRRKNFDDLKLCLMIDVIRCYYGLGHRTSLSSPEGIALLLLLVKLFRNDYTITFQGLDSIPNDIINLDGLVPYISDCSDLIDIPVDESVISTILLRFDPKYDRSYRIALYRLCEAISTVDGVISVSEREFLMALLHLDDDDVTNDIEIDTIFNQPSHENEE